jgi:putative transposase
MLGDRRRARPQWRDVVATLERLRFERGLPQRIYRDNGTEFVSAAMDLWAYTNGVVLDFSRRGKPTDNAAIESFNGRFREECLNVHWFASIDDAQVKIDAFRWDHNEHRPHRSLEGLSPREFAEGCSRRPRAHSPSEPKKGGPSVAQAASAAAGANSRGICPSDHV